MAQRHGRILARLSELGLSLAETVHQRALAAETPAETAELGLAFHRISRSVRQTLALEAQLERGRLQDAAQDRAVAERSREALVQHRRAQVRLAVERLIWDEHEDRDEVEDLLDGLHQRLDLQSLTDDFITTPVEAHIQRLCADLGLAHADEDDASVATPRPSAPAYRCADTSPGAERPELAEDYWRSSA